MFLWHSSNHMKAWCTCDLGHRFVRNCPMFTVRPAWRNVNKIRRSCYNQLNVSYSMFGNTFQEKPVSCRKKSIDLLCKSIDWFLYDTSFYWKVFSNWLEFVLLINNCHDLHLVVSLFTLFFLLLLFLISWYLNFWVLQCSIFHTLLIFAKFKLRQTNPWPI